MSSTRAGSYRDVLTLPRALPTFGFALVGRLSYGLLPISLLFTVQHATHSFATAGAATAALGLTSFVLPFKSRLVDRHGQARVLPALAAVAATTLTALAVLVLRAPVGAAACLALATLAGLAAPPLGPAMRATWRRLTRGTALRTRAYSLDSVCEESLYLLGPLLAGLLFLVGPAAIALLATAALMLVGTVGMVLAAPPAPATSYDEVPTTSGRGPLTAPGMAPVLLLVSAAAVGVSLAYTGIAARAIDAGDPAAAGWIEAAIAAGSVAGGLWWGRRRHQRGHRAHLAGLVTVLGLGIGFAGIMPGLLTLGVVMAGTGLAVAPLFVVSYLAVDDLAPEHQRTEASTWVNTVSNVGSAFGAAGAGVLVEHVAIGSAFAVGAAVLLVAGLGAALRRDPGVKGD